MQTARTHERNDRDAKGDAISSHLGGQYIHIYTYNAHVASVKMRRDKKFISADETGLSLQRPVRKVKKRLDVPRRPSYSAHPVEFRLNCSATLGSSVVHPRELRFLKINRK